MDRASQQLHGKFILQVQAHPDFGLSFGQDRLIPIWVATLVVRAAEPNVRFRSGSEMFEEFGLARIGSTIVASSAGLNASSVARFISAVMTISRSEKFGNSLGLPSSITFGSGT
jgi:hypothetical protein